VRPTRPPPASFRVTRLTNVSDPGSPVLQAMYINDRAAAEQLADGQLLDVAEAAALGRVDRLVELLDAEPSAVSQRTNDGFTPLHLAAFFGGALAVGLLIDRGADVSAVADNPMRVQPLHSAAAARDADAVRCLLEAGAAVDAQQMGGWTALQEAAGNGDAAMVDVLLAGGADVSVTNDAGKPAADIAEEGGFDELAQRLRP